MSISPLLPSSSALLSPSVSAAGSGTAVSSDLSTYTQAKSAGDTSSVDAAIVQLRADLATEESSMFSALLDPEGTSSTDAGDQLLSGMLNLSSGGVQSTAIYDIPDLSASFQDGTATIANADTSLAGENTDTTTGTLIDEMA